MTPEQLRDHLYGKWDVRGSLRRRAIRDAEDQAVEAACAKYRHEDNPFLQQMANRCNPHAPCPCPDSCNADQICIYRCQWFADTEGSRRQLRSMADGEIWFKPTSETYKRHTVDITAPAPQYVEDELLAFERGWRRAKYAWLFLGVLVVAYVVIRVWAGGGR